MNEKRCCDCGETKREADFYERKKGTGKRKAECKPCSVARTRAWAVANPERLNAIQRRYRSKNRGKVAARQAAYRERVKSTPGARWEQVKQMPHTLYRLRGEGGELLYVGITSCFAYRMKQHEIQKDWWSEVAQIEREDHPDRASADSAETKAIRSENPRYNVRKR